MTKWIINININILSIEYFEYKMYMHMTDAKMKLLQGSKSSIIKMNTFFKNEYNIFENTFSQTKLYSKFGLQKLDP